MRPPDEDPHGPTHPNSISAVRRGSRDDNILARLERDGRRQAAGTQSTRARILLYSVSGALVLALIAALALLAHDNASDRRMHLIAAARPAAAVPVAVAHAGVAAATDTLGGAGKAAIQTQAARIVDQAAGRSARQDASVQAAEKAVPPLVLLSPSEVSGRQSRRAPARPARDKAAAVSGNERTHGARAANTRKGAPVMAHAPATRAAAPHRPRKAQARAAAKADLPGDSDVALLSAIIMQSNRHAEERARLEAAAACGSDKKCVQKLNSEP